MTDAQQTPLPEAPVSFTVRYRSTSGYDCMLTLRGHDATDILRQAHVLMERMAAAGALPHDDRPSNGARPASGDRGLADDHAGDPAWCPIHNCEMKRREKDGQTWYSHKTADGEWCRGKAPKGGAA